MNWYLITIYSPDGKKVADRPLRVQAPSVKAAQEWIDSLVGHPVPTDIVREPEKKERETNA